MGVWNAGARGEDNDWDVSEFLSGLECYVWLRAGPDTLATKTSGLRAHKRGPVPDKHRPRRISYNLH